jgi:hypothetical protein
MNLDACSPRASGCRTSASRTAARDLDRRLESRHRRGRRGGTPLRLALSLHAPEDACARSSCRSTTATARGRARRVPALARARPHAVFVEYLMLAGVNDRYEQAVALAELLDPARLQGQPDPVQPDRRGLRRARAGRRSTPSRLARGARPASGRSGSLGAETSTRRVVSWRRVGVDEAPGLAHVDQASVGIDGPEAHPLAERAGRLTAVH